MKDDDDDDDAEEPESARDVAVTLWALARWARQRPRPEQQTAADAAPLASALAARAADALDRELPPASSSSSASSPAYSASHALVVALESRARLQPPGAAALEQQRWLSLARRALPSLSGRGLARLVRALGGGADRARPPAPAPPSSWMRALQLRVLRLAAAARVRAGELADVLLFFRAARWCPGAAWWRALLSATEATGLAARSAPLREALAQGARAAAIRVGGALGAPRTGGGGGGDAAAIA